MTRDLIGLAWRFAVWMLAALAVVLLLMIVDLVLDPLVPMALALVLATVLWAARHGLRRADASAAPTLDPHADVVDADARDLRVRRLEDVLYSAQPSRRMTARSLGRLLGEAADERARNPEAPPLSEPLQRLIDEARHPDADAHPIGPISRRDLHAYLRELAHPPSTSAITTPAATSTTPPTTSTPPAAITTPLPEEPRR